MTWSLQTERGSITTALTSAIPSLTPYDTMPAAPTVPAFMVSPSPDVAVTYDAMPDAVTLHLIVLVVVQKVTDDTAQDAMDEYISTSTAKSIAAAVQNGQRVVREVRGYGAYTFGSGEAAATYLGAQFAVDVLAG